MKVIDASAVSAMLFAEPEADVVVEWIGGEPLAAPTLIAYEVANTCWKKLKRHPDLRAELLAAQARLFRLDLRQSEVDSTQVVLLAEKTGLTAYDASYLWLALNLGAELVTLDDRLRQAAAEA